MRGGATPRTEESSRLGFNRAQKVVLCIPGHGDVPCGRGRQYRRLRGERIGGDIPSYGGEIPMASGGGRSPRCDPDDPENRLARHDIEVVPPFAGEGGGRHDGPPGGPVVVTAEIPERQP